MTKKKNIDELTKTISSYVIDCIQNNRVYDFNQLATYIVEELNYRNQRDFNPYTLENRGT